MELRHIVAISLLVFLALVMMFLLTRKMRERRKFRIRQQGRGKSAD